MGDNKDSKIIDKFTFMGASSGKVVCGVALLTAVLSLGYSGYDTYRLVDEESSKDAISLDENGEYNSKEEVAAYIYKYNHLPDNYISKTEAEALGWIGGNVEEVAPGKSIGGDRFYALYNADRGIPKTEGRYYTECDVNTDGKSERGSERLIFSNDGIILYTGDHYQTFEIVYGDEVLSEFY